MANNGKSQFDANLKKAFSDIKKRAKKGMFLSVALVKRESQKRTPVDEGNLKGSHYTNVQETNQAFVGEVGCTAEYAVYVHEDMDAFHRVGEAKFLENAIKDNERNILKLIGQGGSV